LAEILEGARRTLQVTDVCIIEVGIFNRLKGKVRPLDVWTTLDKAGLHFFDIANIGHNKNGVTRTVDCVFVREHLFAAAYARSGKDAKSDPENLRRRLAQRKAALQA
jgi:hypothetical protein